MLFEVILIGKIVYMMGKKLQLKNHSIAVTFIPERSVEFLQPKREGLSRQGTARLSPGISVPGLYFFNTLLMLCFRYQSHSTLGIFHFR